MYNPKYDLFYYVHITATLDGRPSCSAAAGFQKTLQSRHGLSELSSFKKPAPGASFSKYLKSYNAFKNVCPNSANPHYNVLLFQIVDFLFWYFISRFFLMIRVCIIFFPRTLTPLCALHNLHPPSATTHHYLTLVGLYPHLGEVILVVLCQCRCHVVEVIIGNDLHRPTQAVGTTGGFITWKVGGIKITSLRWRHLGHNR